MRFLKALGGSVTALYLICTLLAVYSVGGSAPAVAAESSSSSQSVEIYQAEAPAIEQDESVIAEVAGVVPDWMVILTSLISLAGLVTAATPSPKDNAVLGVVRKVFDVFALNIWNAKNQKRGDNAFKHLR